MKKEELNEIRAELVSCKTNFKDFCSGLGAKNELLQLILEDSDVNADIETAIAWAPLFVQNWMLGQNLEYTLRNFEYKQWGCKTVDCTNDFESFDLSLSSEILFVNGDKLDPSVNVNKVVTQQGSEPAVFNFSVEKARKYVVMPDHSVLLFDIAVFN